MGILSLGHTLKVLAPCHPSSPKVCCPRHVSRIVRDLVILFHDPNILKVSIRPCSGLQGFLTRFDAVFLRFLEVDSRSVPDLFVCLNHVNVPV